MEPLPIELRIESLNDIVRYLTREGFETITVTTQALVQLVSQADLPRINEIMARAGIGVEYVAWDMTYLFYRQNGRFARQRKSLEELKRQAAERVYPPRFSPNVFALSSNPVPVRTASIPASRPVPTLDLRARPPIPQEPITKARKPEPEPDPPPRYTRKIRLK